MTKQKKDKQLIIRLTREEFDDLQARKTGSELVTAVAGIGNNLNQIARNINGVVKVGALNSYALTIITHLAATERALNAVRGYLES
ncbi:MobC family plasmid mobilization relaxosome protein [Snodgrassella communis]|uniref:MobC family plasmid mobilization relaxosome protein n=1 Tax=Snodgrassella communis TaxID=2946699 RepID=UPI001EF7348E|nr:MobC family plasmid mobilization relaxosome protein [Snodgrassella communis]